MSMKLYGDPAQLRTKKVFVFLQEKSLAFEFVPAKLLDLSSICATGVFPGRVHEPVLVDGGTSVIGAMAICSYIDIKHSNPPLFPRDPSSLMLAQYIEENFYAQLDDLILEISRHEAGEWYSRRDVADGLVKGRLRPIMAFFEHIKAKARYLASDEICIADISVGLALMQMSKHAWIHTSGPYVDHSTFTKMSSDFPLMAQYCNELWEGQSFQNAKELPLIWAESIEVGSDGSMSKHDNVSGVVRLIAANAPSCQSVAGTDPKVR